MGIGWRMWAAMGLLCVAPMAQACRVGPDVDDVAMGVVRILSSGAKPEASWAIEQRAASAPVEAVAKSTLVVCESAHPPTITVESLPRQLFTADREGNVLKLSLAPGDRVYGLGDKSGPMDRRGRVFTMWNTDAYAWDAARDPLYKSIPFFIVVRDGMAFGVLIDDTGRMTIDVGKTDPNAIRVTAANPVDFYVIDGPTPHDVLARYTALTGHTPLPPKWALGFQQSRYTYLPEARVREVAAKLRDRKIPADAIWLDIGFQENNKPFTVDRKAFPQFEGMLGDLRKDGFHTVLIPTCTSRSRKGMRRSTAAWRPMRS